MQCKLHGAVLYCAHNLQPVKQHFAFENYLVINWFKLNLIFFGYYFKPWVLMAGALS